MNDSNLNRLYKITHACLFLLFSLFIFADVELARGADQKSTVFTWQAVYDMILDDEESGDFAKYTMSGDGSKVAVAMDGQEVIVMDADGSNQVTYETPDDYRFLCVNRALATNYDGSRTFVCKCGWTDLFLLEGGDVTRLLDEFEPDSWVYRNPDDVRVTDNGESVYFHTERDVWKVSHEGAGLSKVIDNKNVPLNGEVGEITSVDDYDVSGDGSILAFMASKSYNTDEIYSLQNSGFTQLTNYDDDGKCSAPIISGDGATIVYEDYIDDVYIAVDPDGSNPRNICEAGSNDAGSIMTQDGALMFYDDNLAGGGRLVNTDGSGVFNVMPDGFGVYSLGGISANGTRVCFSQNYASAPYKYRLYVGYLGQSGVVADEPVINRVTYDPSSAPKNSEGSVIISTIDITAANGINDVTVRELSDGKVIDGDWPLKVYSGPRDDGEGPDETAGDGIYTVEYRTRSNAEEYDQVTIRIGVEDTTHTFAVADMVLPFGDCAYDISPTSQNFGTDGGIREVTVDASQSDCTWTVEESLSWASVSPSSGTGDGIVTIGISENPDSSARNGVITIAEQPYTVAQEGNDPSPNTGCSITINQDLSFTIPNAVYDAGPLAGQMELSLDFQYLGEQNGQLMWKLGNVGSPSSLSCSVPIDTDLSFTLAKAIYDGGPLVGQTTLQTEFEYSGEQTGSFLWRLVGLKIID